MESILLCVQTILFLLIQTFQFIWTPLCPACLGKWVCYRSKHFSLSEHLFVQHVWVSEFVIVTGMLTWLCLLCLPQANVFRCTLWVDLYRRTVHAIYVWFSYNRLYKYLTIPVVPLLTLVACIHDPQCHFCAFSSTSFYQMHFYQKNQKFLWLGIVLYVC